MYFFYMSNHWSVQKMVLRKRSYFSRLLEFSKSFNILFEKKNKNEHSLLFIEKAKKNYLKRLSHIKITQIHISKCDHRQFIGSLLLKKMSKSSSLFNVTSIIIDPWSMKIQINGFKSQSPFSLLLSNLSLLTRAKPCVFFFYYFREKRKIKLF